jgi:hypothetical protein
MHEWANLLIINTLDLIYLVSRERRQIRSDEKKDQQAWTANGRSAILGPDQHTCRLWAVVRKVCLLLRIGRAVQELVQAVEGATDAAAMLIHEYPLQVPTWWYTARPARCVSPWRRRKRGMSARRRKPAALREKRTSRASCFHGVVE